MSYDCHYVFIHGFLSNHFIWESLTHYFPHHTCIDLPGYGENKNIHCDTIDAICEYIDSQTKDKVIWVGWSLGGLIAEHLAQHYRDKTLGLITFATNPKFVQSDDWLHAISQQEFDALKNSFMTHAELAMTRFLSLQTQGHLSDRPIKKTLNEVAKRYPLPDAKVIARDFHLLATIDHRELRDKLTVPQLHCLGGQDRLVPNRITTELKYLSDKAQNVTIQEAAHVPFMTHPKECIKLIREFIDEFITKHDRSTKNCK